MRHSVVRTQRQKAAIGPWLGEVIDELVVSELLEALQLEVPIFLNATRLIERHEALAAV